MYKNCIFDKVNIIWYNIYVSVNFNALSDKSGSELTPKNNLEVRKNGNDKKGT